MTQYEVKDPDGVVHRIEALNHTNDSLGLTLYAAGSAVVAIFPKFAWMWQVQAVVAGTAADTASSSAGETTTSGEVVAPAATGE